MKTYTTKYTPVRYVTLQLRKASCRIPSDIASPYYNTVLHENFNAWNFCNLKPHVFLLHVIFAFWESTHSANCFFAWRCVEQLQSCAGQVKTCLVIQDKVQSTHLLKICSAEAWYTHSDLFCSLLFLAMAQLVDVKASYSYTVQSRTNTY